MVFFYFYFYFFSFWRNINHVFAKAIASVRILLKNSVIVFFGIVHWTKNCYFKKMTLKNIKKEQAKMIRSSKLNTNAKVN